MRKLSTAGPRKGFTLLEVLVVGVVCALVLAMIWPSVRPAKFPNRVSCMSRVRQIDIAVIMYAEDYKGRLPNPSPLPNGDMIELAGSSGPLPEYRILSRYFSTPSVLICPSESRRTAVTNFSDLTRSNLSYFFNADVSLTNNPTASILAGDRNLQADAQPVSPGLFVLTTNLDMSWTRELHGMGGNLAFADGHVEFCRTTNLNGFVQRQSSATNRLLVP